MTIGKGKRPRDPNQLAKWIVDRSTRGLAHPNSFGCPVQALLGRGFHFERTRTFGKIPIFSRRRAVHCDSISTVPSTPVK
jgi:hypothetical protein